MSAGHVVWAAPAGAWLAIVAGGAACAMALWGASRAATRWSAMGPLALRICALALLACTLLGPALPAPMPGASTRPSVALLVDLSRSMCTEDEPSPDGAISRLDALRAGWLTPGSLDALARAADVRLVAIGESARPARSASLAGAQPSDGATRLSSALLGVLAEPAPPADIVVLSDGADTDDPTGAWASRVADVARAAGVRIHVVGVGGVNAHANVSVTLEAGPARAGDGQERSLLATVRQSGFDGAPAELVVREVETGREVERRWIELGRPASIEILHAFAAPPAPRPERAVEFEASVEPLPGEGNASDNVARTLVQPPSAPIRVALFENEPSWDSKFLIAALREASFVELTATIGLGKRQSVSRWRTDAALERELDADDPPVAEPELFAQDVVILGRGVERWFSGQAAASLARFVTERGGAVVFLRGAPATQMSPEGRALLDVLASIAPVDWGQGAAPGGSLEATPEGLASPALGIDGDQDPFASMPEVVATRRVDREGTLAITLVRARDRNGAAAAAIVTTQAARGRTLAVLTDGLWRWSFQPDAGGERTDVYRRLWEGVVRWLAHAGELIPGQRGAVSVDPATAPPGGALRVGARFRDAWTEAAPPRVRITGPGGGGRDVALARADLASDRWLATLTPDQEGAHRVDLLDASGEAIASARFDVRETRAEVLDTTARREDLSVLAERSGGRVLPLDGAAELERMLGQRARASAEQRVLEPAWRRWWIFGLIAALLGAEWIWRRRNGLA